MTIQSLDETVKEQAIKFADQIKQAAEFAEKEEEIRIEAERALAVIQRVAGIVFKGRHEYTIGTGRVDSVYGCVIIEYKNPHDPASRLSARKESKGNQEVIKQIKNRFLDFTKEQGQPMNAMFGVGCDGNYFIFIRSRDEKWFVEDPVEVNRYSAERFLWALINMGTKGKSFSPEYLSGDFGSDSPIAQEGVRSLYNDIIKTSSPKARAFFQQWKILFGEVCGYDVNTPSDRIIELSNFYGIEGETKPPELLFSIHTYYAIFMKLLAAEVVAFFHKLPTPLQKILKAPSSIKLKEEMDDLERGSIFRHLNITNFLEGDLFAWYVDAWNDSVEKLVKEIATKLDAYNPGTLSEDPRSNRDLLKKLYQQMFPKSVRHDLGEYYTPDWLAEHVLNDLEYFGDPDKRLLDPACGSGTFLIMAIGRIRRWYDQNRESCGYDEGELARKIVKNIVGFDLNPLAVMAARTNYLIAMRDLIGRLDSIEIPVYLCDSILTPSEYSGFDTWTTGVRIRTRELKTSVANFKIPLEVAKDRQSIAKYTELLEFCVRNEYLPEDFVQRCKDEGLEANAKDLHIELFKVFLDLDHANKNGVWARIIKNSFAPLFCGEFDYVAGNPPWINWENLPAQYRNDTKGLWEKYKLMGTISINKRQKSDQSKTDISILMTYVSVASYLKNMGLLGFVITRSLFQAELGGWHFRQFSLPSGEAFSVERINDVNLLKPFEGQAANVTCTMKLRKGSEMKYPCNWIRWEPIKSKKIHEDTSYDEVIKSSIQKNWIAFPIGINQLQSSWIFGNPKSLEIVRRLIGPSEYGESAREGVNTRGANGIFFVDASEINKNILITNRVQDGNNDKLASYTVSVEPDYLYPLAKGKDVFRWGAKSSSYILLPHEAKSPTNPVSFKSLPKKTQDYLMLFKKDLSNRKKFRNFDPKKENWIGLYSVLASTFSPVKVVWREMSDGIISAVITTDKIPNGQDKILIPDHKLFIIPTNNMDVAYFICAILNSSISSYIIKSYAISTGISTHILQRLPIPLYSRNNQLHTKLAELSKKCHSAAEKGDTKALQLLEEDIDAIVSKLWGITKDELEIVQNALEEVMNAHIKRGQSDT